MQAQWMRTIGALVLLSVDCGMAGKLTVRRDTRHRDWRSFEMQVRATHEAVTAVQMDIRAIEQLEEKGAEPQAPTYNAETLAHESLPSYVTYESCMAVLFVFVIAFGPFLISHLMHVKSSTTALVQAGLTVACLVGGIYAFMNIIYFESSHFEGRRNLTIVESVYVLAQIITTVGYGDIVPAYGQGRVVIGFYVVLSLLLIVDSVCLVSHAVIHRVETYSLALAEQTKNIKSHKEPSSPRAAQPDQGPEQSGDTQALQVLTNCKISYMPVLAAGMSLLVFMLTGILFYHFYPGEQRTWLQACYMTAITMSTVGFGAFTAKTTGGQVFGAFWMLFGVASMASFLAAFSEVCCKLKEQNKHSEESVKTELKKLPRLKGSSKPDRLEFLCFSALHLGIANEEQLEMIRAEFQKLKPDQDDLVAVSHVGRAMHAHVHKSAGESNITFDETESEKRRKSPNHTWRKSLLQTLHAASGVEDNYSP